MTFETLDFADQRAVRDALRKIRYEITGAGDRVGKVSGDIPLVAPVEPAVASDIKKRPTVEPQRPLFSGWYLKLSDYRILSRSEQEELGKQVEAGLRAEEILVHNNIPPGERRSRLEEAAVRGREAQEKFVLHNLRLVRTLALSYTKRTPRVDLDDAFQSGVLGVMRAAQKFDWRRGYTFSTYATWWIRQSMDRDWMNLAPAIHLPIHTWQKFSSPQRGIAEWMLRKGVETTPSLQLALGILRGLDSLDSLSIEDQDAALSANQRILGLAPYVLEYQFDQMSMRKAVIGLIRLLPLRDRRIVLRYFGIGQERSYTLEEVGEMFGLTRERVRQIIANNISIMRHEVELRFWQKDYWSE